MVIRPRRCAACSYRCQGSACDRTPFQFVASALGAEELAHRLAAEGTSGAGVNHFEAEIVFRFKAPSQRPSALAMRRFEGLLTAFCDSSQCALG
jgi:hypothetical protein